MPGIAIILTFFICLSCACAAPGQVDKKFKLAVSTNYHVVTVEEEASGDLLVGGYVTVRGGHRAFLLRCNSNGRVMTRFAPPSDAATVVKVQTRPDGFITALTSRSRNETTADRATVFSSRGIVTNTFELPGMGFLLFDDGSLQCVTYTNAPSSPQYGRMIFSPDGEVISSFPHTDWAPTDHLHAFADGSTASINWDVPKYSHKEYPFYSRWGIYLKADRLFRCFAQGDSDTLYCGGTWLLRFTNRWQVDSNFQAAYTPYQDPPVQQMALLPDDKLAYVAAAAYGTDIYSYSSAWQIRRLNPDGSRDEQFDVGAGPNGLPLHLLALKNGDLLVWGDFTRFSGLKRSGIVRIHSD